MTLTAPPRSDAPETAPGPLAAAGAWLRSPIAPYQLILFSGLALTVFGLVMVLSASGVLAYQDTGSSYSTFLNQALYAGIGLVLAFIGSRLPVTVWKRLGWLAILAGIALQLLVFSPLGVGEYQGNQNWIEIGGRALQPSEFGKLSLVVFGAMILARKRKVIHRPLHALIPFVPLGLILVALVMVGNDLGTALVMLAIIVGMMWTVGVPAAWFGGLGLLIAGGVAYLALGSANRMARIQAWIGNICSGPHDSPLCFQKVHAEWALADGGWWGIGLGESREKWGLLPEPYNDFILAIIGEELGLMGTFFVLGLFAVLAYACFRIVNESEDMFTRLAAAGVMIWMLSQALINIGSVIGMLPVIGVPLPLISAGGSALVSSLVALGLLLSLARSLPGARRALAQRGPLNRLRQRFAPARSRSRGGRR